MGFRRFPRSPTLALLALSTFAFVGGASGQEAGQVPSSTASQPSPPSAPNTTASPPAMPPGSQKAGSSSSRGNTSVSGETRRLPEDSTTKQIVTVNGRTLSFTATAGSLRLFNQGGEPQADIAYTAYQLDGAEARSRPVTFFFNGGPGASSAYLQLGCAGPWRLPIEGEGAVSSASPELKPNAETWLDFTDMV